MCNSVRECVIIFNYIRVCDSVEKTSFGGAVRRTKPMYILGDVKDFFRFISVFATTE